MFLQIFPICVRIEEQKRKARDAEEEDGMRLVVCVEDRWGMAFNGRRLSMDEAVRERILEFTDGTPLWMSPYSERQFGDLPAGREICADEAFMDRAGQGEYCFAELCDPSGYREQLEEITLFRWNRRYPADLYFDPALLDGFSLAASEEFPGTSHEKITMEVYRR